MDAQAGTILSGMIVSAAIALFVSAFQIPESALRAPTTASEWKERGVEMITQRKPEAALAAFSKACDLDRKEEDACYYLGRQLLDLGRYQEAIAPFDIAVRAAPRAKLGRTHRAAALNLVALGSLEKAENHFKEAVRANRGPESARAEALTDYGAFQFRQARSSEALSTLEQAVKIAPEFPRAHAELGRVLLHMNKPKQAAEALERAVELDSRSSGVRLLLGRTYLLLGRRAEGERYLRLGREAWDRDNAPTAR